MGQMLIEAVMTAEDCRLVAALDAPESATLGLDAAAFLGKASGITITADVPQALQAADVLIDFTRPEGSLAYAKVCIDLGVRMVIGTTGFTEAQKAILAASAEKTAIVFSPNMSVGVNVTLKLLQMAAQALHTGYDIEIIETHHKHKVDAPSGTALHMGEVIAQAQGTRLAERAIYARQGHTGERPAGSIGFAALRGGDIVGDHTVLFAGEGERLEITHKSSSRVGYAQGSLRAARFLAGRHTGLYDMFDVLGLAQPVS